MPTLNILGQQVNVDDSFMQLSPEEQQQTVNHIATQIKPPAPQRAAPSNLGEAQEVSDEAELAKYHGVVPDAAKTFGYSAANTAALGVPSHLVAGASYLASDKPWGWDEYKKQYDEQKEYEKALERQHPVASGLGTAAGIGAGFLIPGGPIAGAAEAARAASAAKYGSTIGNLAGVGTAAGVGAGIGAAGSAIETLDPMSMQTLYAAGMGAGIGGAAQHFLPGILSKFSQLPKEMDAHGNLVLTDNGREVLAKTFPDLKPEDITSLESQAAKVFAQKGETADAAKEALLKHMGVDPSRSMVTGERPLEGAATEVATTARQQAADTLGAKARSIAEPLDRADTSIAEMVPERAKELQKAARKQFEQAKGIEGEVPSSVVGPEGPVQPNRTPQGILLNDLASNVSSALKASQVPTNLDGLQGYNQSKNLMKYLQDNVLAGSFPFGKNLDAKNFNAIRSNINDHWYAARNDANDQRVINSIRNAFDQTVDTHIITPSMFTGDGQKVVDELKKSRAMWSDMQKTLHPTDGGKGSQRFNTMMNDLVDRSTGKIKDNIEQGSYDSAQGVINSGLVNRQLGSAFHDKLTKLFGAGSDQMNAVNAQIRSIALDTGGDVRSLAGNIDKFLAENPTLATRVFDGKNGNASVSELRKLSTAIKVLNNTPSKTNAQKQSTLMGLASNMSASAAGLIAAHVNPTLGAAVYGGSKAAQAAGRGWNNVSRGVIEAGGAPVYRPIPDWAKGRAVMPSGSPTQSKDQERNYAAPPMLPPLTIHRATGGRVSDRLISEVERAKKLVNSKTEPLLNADDSHVAHALAIANQNFEG